MALAQQFNQLLRLPDLILATDMLDLTTFLSLTRHRSKGIPVALYFHENQITYPWSPDDADVALGRNNQYGFINYTSALAADKVFFNSEFHRRSFTGALKGFLNQFPDHRGLDTIDVIKEKSEVLSLGMDLRALDAYRQEKSCGPPVLLWNHRWEYDKGPELFFSAMFRLKDEGVAFRLVVLGQGFGSYPAVFDEAKERLADRLLHFGYAEDFARYAELLWLSHILPVTSRQDFFGGSVVEAVYCGCYPILPRRLAYPEHLPGAMHQAHFYEGEKDFYGMLKAVLNDWQMGQSFNGNSLVKHYDWGRMAPLYDERFEALCGVG